MNTHSTTSNEGWITWSDRKDWIEWNGGACPVPRETFVRLRYRNGVESTPAAAVVNWPWADDSENPWIHDGGPGDIIAYRIVERGK